MCCGRLFTCCRTEAKNGPAPAGGAGVPPRGPVVARESSVKRSPFLTGHNPRRDLFQHDKKPGVPREPSSVHDAAGQRSRSKSSVTVTPPARLAVSPAAGQAAAAISPSAAGGVGQALSPPSAAGPHNRSGSHSGLSPTTYAAVPSQRPPALTVDAKASALPVPSAAAASTTGTASAVPLSFFTTPSTTIPGTIGGAPAPTATPSKSL